MEDVGQAQPFDLGGVRSTCSNASSPCLNRDNASFRGDSKDNLKSRAVVPLNQPMYVSPGFRTIPSKSAQNFEYRPFCDSSSSTTSSLFPTALLAETTPRNASSNRHREEKGRMFDGATREWERLRLRRNTHRALTRASRNVPQLLTPQSRLLLRRGDVVKCKALPSLGLALILRALSRVSALHRLTFSPTVAPSSLPPNRSVDVRA